MTASTLGRRLGRAAAGAVLVLALTSLVAPIYAEEADRSKEIADLEQQIAALKQKITDLRKTEPAKGDKKALTLDDAANWNSVRGATLSDDGQWFASAVGSSDGESQVTVRQTKGDKQYKFPAGKGGGSGIAFSADNKWVTFTTSAGKGSTGGGKTVLVKLETGDKQEWEGVRRAAFSGEAANWVALHRSPPAPAAGPPAPTTPVPAPTPGPGRTPPTPEKSVGTDLVLRELTTGNELVLGNVSEFGFDKAGKRLVLLIDAAGQVGNGIQLRDMASGVLASLETGKASYQRLNWTDDGSAFAVLKGTEDKEYDGKRFSLIGYTDFDAKSPRKVIFDPAKDAGFPKDMTISANRAASWREDRSAITFGISELKKKTEEKKEPAKDGPAKEPAKDAPKDKDTPKDKAGGKGKGGDKPDLVVWHWQDERLQSQQQVQATNDKSQAFSAIYHVADNKFVRLADDKLKNVNVPARGAYALGVDSKPYQLQGTLDGKRYSDVYAVDLKTGERKQLLKKNRWMNGLSPDGKQLLYYDDGQFRTCDVATGKTAVITKDVPTSFIDTEDDHNVDRPPTSVLGWTKDAGAVLISDNWDLWLVPVAGGAAKNLTVSAKKDGLRYRMRYRLDPDEKGIDFAKQQYFSVQNEWTKEAGVVRLDGGNPGGVRVLWGDAEFGSLQKAEKADVFLYTRETYKDYPDYYVDDASFKAAKRLTDANPQQDKYAWCAGKQLVEYKGVKGEKLQGLLLLPAGYEKGKSYPTLVYIYEKLTDRSNRYLTPSMPGGGFNAALYTSGGYAVLMPDITYLVNDPGISAVTCVTNALKAAEATGVVDPKRVGLHGHSWGGYQTAFIITQSNAFKAAVAGAPLTNLISMYSSIYWNTGSANQPIFESSQGRFTSGYWDNQEAYLRNSPVFHAKNVQTPLILLHNDKDGAVDWNQGIEYFNTLRRLQKPVVLLQYKGENHGLAKLANRKDYAVRMREFFDHHLMGKPAPAWLNEGVPHLKLDEHLQERTKE